MVHAASQDANAGSTLADPSARGISVILPTFNNAHFLPASLGSILRQTYAPIEIIVVDDGSTDDTREVLRPYTERIRYLYQPNAGLSAARNTGIKNATHPYLAFLDADDEWLPEMLARAMEKFQQLSADFGVVACLAHRIDLQGQRLALNQAVREITGEITAADILLMSRFGATAVAVRRRIFDDCGLFDTDLRSSEDRDMWIRVAQRWRIFLHEERLLLIRRHTGSMSSNAARMKLNMRKVIRKAWHNRVMARHRWDFWLQVQAILHYQTALISLGTHRRLAALGDLLVSVCCWPLPLRARRINSAISLIRLRTFWQLLKG
jgi:glycosyltransferase involved in cell wall biosynthesis